MTEVNVTATPHGGDSVRETSPYLEVNAVSKQFPGVQALRSVTIHAFSGEVMGLVGVNGAGKSTLMNVLGGIVRPDEGTIRIAGRDVGIGSPRAAEDLGIAFIQQEIQVFQHLRVYENILISDLDRWRVAGPFLNRKRMRSEAATHLAKLGCDVDLDARSETLVVGQKQMVQIARALSQGGRILLFDEPTSSLSGKEKENLFRVIRNLKASGFVIFYITHFLDEVYEVCDSVTVLRDGEVAVQGRVGELTQAHLVRHMIGREVENPTGLRERKLGAVVLEAAHLTGSRFPNDASFRLRQGEILGVWGALGSGRSELLRALIGIDKVRRGTIAYGEGQALQRMRGMRLFRKVGYITEERHLDGLFLQMPLWKNVTSACLRAFASPILRIMSQRREVAKARSYLADVKVKALDEGMLASQLSGGNQQKTIIAKWLMKEPRLMVMDEPTKGVDVGAKQEIQKIIFEKARSGMSFIIVSSELDEIMTLSDRIIVLRNGKIVSELAKGEFSKDRLMGESTHAT
jgi:ribose transport system ATP-binding protein